MRSKQTSEQCERTSNWTSEWPSTYILIHGFTEPQCGGDGGGWDRGDIDGGGGDERERLWGSDGKGDGKLKGGSNDVMAVSSYKVSDLWRVDWK